MTNYPLNNTVSKIRSLARSSVGRKAGTAVTFDAASKTLTLDGTTINTTFTGDGKLTIDYSSSKLYCFSVSSGSLTLKDINMSIAGNLRGHNRDGSKYLYIDLADDWSSRNLSSAL